MSFDILPDSLGMERNQYPHTIYIVCGTQAEKADRNSVMVVKMSNLTKTFKVIFKKKTKQKLFSEFVRKLMQTVNRMKTMTTTMKKIRNLNLNLLLVNITVASIEYV